MGFLLFFNLFLVLAAVLNLYLKFNCNWQFEPDTGRPTDESLYYKKQLKEEINGPTLDDMIYFAKRILQTNWRIVPISDDNPRKHFFLRMVNFSQLRFLLYAVPDPDHFFQVEGLNSRQLRYKAFCPFLELLWKELEKRNFTLWAEISSLRASSPTKQNGQFWWILPL